VRLLRQLFLTNGPGYQYQAETLQEEAAQIDESLDPETLELGLYLSQYFGVLWTSRLSDDRLQMFNCGMSERVINLKEPQRDWNMRARSAREAITRQTIPIELVQAAAYEELPEYSCQLQNESAENDFWSLLHPCIVPEAEKQFRPGLYADAVLAALKIINIKITRRTGLDLDGAQLMTKAVAPTPLFMDDGERLIFSCKS
jgi:hypothetical protein